jgi:hypothetical protein
MNQLLPLVILVLFGLVVYMAVGEDVTRAARPHVRNFRAQNGKYLTRGVIVPGIVFAALALVMRDIILTPYLLAVGVFLVNFRLKTAKAQASTITPRHVSQLVLAFRGAYQLEPAVFKSLQEASKKVEEPLRTIVTNAVEAYFMTSSTARAFDEFRKRISDNALLEQFLYILEMSESASDTSMAEALDSFVTRLRGYEELQREVETGLSGITGQTSFMQLLAIAIAFVIAFIPNLRGAYTSSLIGRIGYAIVMAVIVGTSYYIDKQVLNLKEKTL